MKLEKLVDHSGMLLAKDVTAAGISKQTFYRFIEKAQYEKVSHGIYVSPDAWKDEEYVISLRCPRGIFSHDVALYYHGLTDREPIQTTITTYTGYGTTRLVNDGIKVFTVKKELLDVGKTTHVTSFGHTIPIYNLERTICDLIRSRSWFEIQDYQTALKSYVKNKNKDLNELMEYARLFHVDKMIRQYMEVML